MNHAAINLSEIAKQVAREIRETEPSKSVEFETDDNMEAVGDPVLLRCAFANLIGNAWKFTAKCAQATIEIPSGRKKSCSGLKHRWRAAEATFESWWSFRESSRNACNASKVAAWFRGEETSYPAGSFLSGVRCGYGHKMRATLSSDLGPCPSGHVRNFFLQIEVLLWKIWRNSR